MLKENIFKQHINKVFIETGSYLGDGIQAAIDAGFNKIYSIELSDKYYQICTDRFKLNSNVTIIKGDSCEELSKLIKTIKTPITFWLDGHYSCGDTACGQYISPLIQELGQISQHKIKTHTIIIDDMRCWKEPNPKHGFQTDDIIKALSLINSDYQIQYVDGYNPAVGIEPNDILIATKNPLN